MSEENSNVDNEENKINITDNLDNTDNVKIEIPSSEENSGPSVNEMPPPPEPTIVMENVTETQVDATENKNKNLTSNLVEQDKINSTETQAETAPVVEPPEPNTQQSPSERINRNDETPKIGVAASQMNKHPHRNNHKFAVIITIAVAVTLALFVIYVYISAQENIQESTTQTTNSQQEKNNPQDIADESQATSAEIDEATKELEESVNILDNENDFPEEELSDTQLDL